MSRFSYCQECGEKLRHVAIFCAKCGQPSCSWHCHTQHLAQHAAADAPAPSDSSENVPANVVKDAASGSDLLS